MKSVSIRDIEKGIVTSQSPFNQQIGSFSHFFSEDRKRNWHRINMENLLLQNNINQEGVQNILMQGFKAILLSDYNQNIKLSSIDSGIKSMSNELVLQKKILENSNSVLNEILESIKNPRAIEAKEKANQASVNIKDAITLEKIRAERLLNESITLLQESIKINDYDYKTHFDIGWLYSFFKNDLEKAEYHYDTSVIRSISKDKKFAAFALRHLADTKFLLGNIDGAIKAISEAEKIEEKKNLETSFEFVRYLSAAGKGILASEKIRKIIKQNPIYYALTEKEIDLNKQPVIKKCLENLSEEKRNGHRAIVRINISELKNKYNDVLNVEVLNKYLETKKKDLNDRINDANYFQLVSYTTSTFKITDNNWRTERDVLTDKKNAKIRTREKNKKKKIDRKAKNKRTVILIIKIILFPILIPLFILFGYLSAILAIIFGNENFYWWYIIFFITIPIQLIIALFFTISDLGTLFENYFTDFDILEYIDEVQDDSSTFGD